MKTLKRPLEKARRTWENNIKMGLREIRCNDVDWINLAQERNQWWVLVNGNEPSVRDYW
jgi:hypothetical protein